NNLRRLDRRIWQPNLAQDFVFLERKPGDGALFAKTKEVLPISGVSDASGGLGMGHLAKLFAGRQFIAPNLRALRPPLASSRCHLLAGLAEREEGQARGVT